MQGKVKIRTAVAGGVMALATAAGLGVTLVTAAAPVSAISPAHLGDGHAMNAATPDANHQPV